MLHPFSIQLRPVLAGVLCLAAIALPGCAVNLPPGPASNPAAASAPEAATPPLRPTLVATSRNFLSPHADDRAEKAKQMDMSKKQPASSPAGAAHFTCPMHPEIQQPKPGQCPECGMTLVEKGVGS